MSTILSSLFSVLPLPTSLISNYTLTSLNFLFFYLTWLTLVLSHSPLKISVFSTLIIRLGCFWLPALLVTSFDLLLPDLAGSCKFHPSSVSMLPSTAPGLLLRAAINDALGVGLHALAVYALPFPLFPVNKTLPLLPTVLYDIFLSQIVSAGVYYYLHRSVHYLWPALHAQHHSHPPTPLLAHAQNPADYLLLSLLPTYITPLLRRSHILTFLIILALQCVVDVVRFSGYQGLWGAAGGLSRRTEGHYYNRGTCYFGIWGILDYMHGTSPANLEADAQRTFSRAKQRAKDEWDGMDWDKPLPNVPMPKAKRGKLSKPRPRAVSKKQHKEEEGESVLGVMTRNMRRRAVGS
ncbi:hypothetical protein CALVIDRAFT_534193 [Calocera viscosa TUFC12733]|uniref:Fatty acid hydroxylase domain-containing protein n=1 Tax=Calocera viscosa (strain TUFC12733) TaxID=1330018 RepID=A0A167QHP8_CALVF|nr:hypothetical protein CALVIDRAFT_534193 [Calocera viscosa TUFC12733]